MNKAVIRYMLGQVLKIEALLMLLPCIVAVIYQESAGWAFLLTALICGLSGILMTLKKPDDFVFYLKEGCITTALSWIFMSFFGCLPFVISKEIPMFTDALFETISGFTTTGASILSDIESLSKSILFWRSFTHWVGGMGVLVFLLAIIPLSGGSNINLMRAESPGPSVGKLVPKIRYTARILYIIYFGITVAQTVLLMFGGLALFDSLTISFGTAGTGGFGILNDSIVSYSPYIQWVITIFMILFGVNFNAYYLLLYKGLRKAIKIEEVKYYFGIIFVATTVIAFNIYDGTMSLLATIRHAAFQVGSIITTTGFSTVDFNLWPTLSKLVLVLLMFVGACAGSTGGGIKVSRFLIAIKAVGLEINSYIHPKSVKNVKMDDKQIDRSTILSVCVYFITFLILFVASVGLISLEGKDMVTNFTAVAATINNIGPGLEAVGPMSNFAHFNVFSKCVLMFDMLAGRLELFPLIILFNPKIVKDLLVPKSKRTRNRAN